MSRPSNLAAGLQGQEIDIIQLWDDGLSIERIASQLGKKPRRVTDIVTRFSGMTDQSDKQWRADLRGASAALLTAITQVHGRHAA